MANEHDDPLAMLRAPLVYHAPGMDTVAAPRSVTYQGTAEGDLRMDVYAPSDLPAGERRPVVIFVHGGPIPAQLPLSPTEWGVFQGYGRLAAASGWIGVTFNHRFFGYDALERAGGDVAAAVAYVREHADELGVDADRICLWAFSGGGPFLADALRESPAFLRCLVAYYALLDLRPMAGMEGVAGVVTPEVLARFSPVAVLEAGAPARSVPLLVARAGQDNPGLNAMCDAFVRAALTVNLPLDLLNHPAGYHAFDARNDDARTGEIFDATLRFLHAHLEG